MAVNPMQRKARNMFLLGMLVMLVIGGIAVGFLIYYISTLNETIETQTQYSVLMLKQDVQAGTELTPEMVTSIQVENDIKNKLTKTTVNGKSALVGPELKESVKEKEGEEYKIETKIALKKGVILTEDMVNDVTEPVKKDVRIQEYNMIKLPSKLEKGNYIDVRLTLPTGQDYVVMCKKRIEACDTNTIWVKTSEAERMLMNNAIIEHFIITGSDLYAIIYNEAGLQSAPDITYQMSNEVNTVYRRNPNILDDAKKAYTDAITTSSQRLTEAREAIDKALAQYSEESLGNIESGLDSSREKQTSKRLQYISKLNADKY